MTENHSILANCTAGGCGAKIEPGALAGLLSGLSSPADPKLLVGFDHADDGAVYALNAETALISTVDFFSPMVEDPRSFGRIAAANALSDVYAMGGKPILALNLVCFPEKLPKSILAEILAGGSEKLAEAGAVIGGGHSIYDKETKYGLAVTGTVHPDRLIRNDSPQPGDLLILTKPLGTGIILAAARGGAASPQALANAVAVMERLNQDAAQAMADYPVHACTDVTGFGLLAHILEMSRDRVTAQIDPQALPILPEALAYAQAYLLTAAGQRNREYFEQQLQTPPPPSGSPLDPVKDLKNGQSFGAPRDAQGDVLSGRQGGAFFAAQRDAQGDVFRDRKTGQFFEAQRDAQGDDGRQGGQFFETQRDVRSDQKTGPEGESPSSLAALPFALQELLFDPQTSGGLLLSVGPEHARSLLARIQVRDPAARIIARFVPASQEGPVCFKPLGDLPPL